MPMRGELAVPTPRSQPNTQDDSAWAVIAFCLIGLLVTLYHISQSLDQLPLLVMQYNLG